MRKHTANTAQLGFDSWLRDADEENERRSFLRSVSHLPGTWEEAVPYYRTLLGLHHAAMLEANEAEVIRLRDEAHDLAARLNGGTFMGICEAEGTGRRLEAGTACAGDSPLKWGQAGSFVLDHDGMAVRIEMDGLFGIGSTFHLWPGFKAHAVDRRKPFISDTGFRSFLGCGLPELVPGQTPEQFAALMLADYVEELEGRLFKVKRQREAA